MIKIWEHLEEYYKLGGAVSDTRHWHYFGQVSLHIELRLRMYRDQIKQSRIAIINQISNVLNQK